MNTERWRLFVAVPIGEQLRRDLAAAVEEWKKRPDLAGLRWTDPDSWHVTLAFLGDVAAANVYRVIAGIREVASHHAGFEVPTRGLGVFPSTGAPRVLWYGVADPHGLLHGLAADLQLALAVDGVPLRAHVTLARGDGLEPSTREWLREPLTPAMRLDVSRIELERSHETSSGRKYERIDSFMLGPRIRSARPDNRP